MIFLLSFSFAASSLDYGALNAILKFAACEMRSCVDVYIMDDITLENDESFDLTLERTSGLNSRITLDPVNGVVEITDNDADFLVVHKGNRWCKHTMYALQYNADNIICSPMISSSLDLKELTKEIMIVLSCCSSMVFHTNAQSLSGYSMCDFSSCKFCGIILCNQWTIYRFIHSLI